MEHNSPHNFQLKLSDSRGGAPLIVKSVPAQNIVNRLIYRELRSGRRSGTEKYLERSMYQSIFPNFTVTTIEKPPCFLRKFTPDGKQFIAFSPDQMSVEVYSFKGAEAATHLFENYKKDTNSSKEQRSENEPSSSSSNRPPPRKKRKSEHRSQGNSPSETFIGPECTDALSSNIRKKIFDSVFSLKFKIPVAPQGEQLNRECSLFTENSRYLIVGSTSFISDDSHPLFQDMFQNNESIEPHGRFQLEDYSLHLIDLKLGTLSDSIRFKVDKIYLSHNQGIYLYNQTLAILSVQHQTIYIYYVVDGEFQLVRTIGRFCDEDDDLILSQVPSFLPSRAFFDPFLNTLKHRMLVHIYKNAFSTCPSKSKSNLARFHQYYEQLKNLKIWKMQLLDETHLLLKYASPDTVTLKATEPNSQYCIFLIYNIGTTEIIGLFDNSSEELVDLFENYTDNFRNNFLTLDSRYISSPSNNIFSKQIHSKFRQTITSAKFGGVCEATKRILTMLPISAQSFSSSPYLDQALFSYDDHRVSVMERPKACGELPIRFYGRDSGFYKFQIHAGILSRGQSSSQSRRLVAFTFHPSAPFAISVQRANTEYLVNFHLRLDTGLSLPDPPSSTTSTFSYITNPFRYVPFSNSSTTSNSTTSSSNNVSQADSNENDNETSNIETETVIQMEE